MLFGLFNVEVHDHVINLRTNDLLKGYIVLCCGTKLRFSDHGKHFKGLAVFAASSHKSLSRLTSFQNHGDY